MAEPTGSEMNAPEKGAEKSSKHGAMWARTATSHIAQGLQEGHPLNPDFEKIAKRGKQEMSSNSSIMLFSEYVYTTNSAEIYIQRFSVWIGALPPCSMY